MLALLIAALIITLWRLPERASSRVITQRLIVPLARSLMRIERRHVLLVLLTVPVLLFASELLLIGGSLDAGLIMLWDISTYVDILLLTSITGIATRTATAWRVAKARLFRTRARALRAGRRARSTRRKPERAEPPTNDDDRAEATRQAA